MCYFKKAEFQVGSAVTIKKQIMKLCTVLGVGHDSKQRFSVSMHWAFRRGKFFAYHPHDGPVFIDDIYIYKGGCYISKEVVARCGFYNHKKHGLFTDRGPENNRDKVTVALIVNGFIHFHDFKHLHKKNVIQYFKRQENSKSSLTILVLSSKYNSVSFEIRDGGQVRKFVIHLSIDGKNKTEVKVVEIEDQQYKPRFWKPVLSLVCDFFQPWKPRVDDDQFCLKEVK